MGIRLSGRVREENWAAETVAKTREAGRHWLLHGLHSPHIQITVLHKQANITRRSTSLRDIAPAGVILGHSSLAKVSIIP